VIVQECAFGLVQIRRDAARLRFAAPALQRRPVEATLLAEIAAALGVNAERIRAAQLLDNGPVWLTLLLDSRQTVLQLSPDHPALKNLGYKVGVATIESAAPTTVLIARSNREARASSTRSVSSAVTPDLPAVEVRAFAASVGVNEDPVTGSLNASLAQWLIADGLAPAVYIAEQGHCLGRAGRVHIEQDEQGQVWVGGESVTCVEGTVKL
jgi:PhzF family phenazine biosynthesis protein